MYDVTVTICCYKQKIWLNACLRSLATQTMSKNKFEVIVVNDDPEAEIASICDSFKDTINIRLINNKENIGLSSSLNKALKISRGRYFCRVDCDDYVSSDFLYILSLYLKHNKNVQAVSCDYIKVNDKGEILSRHDHCDEQIACGVMFTYESLLQVGFYDERWKMREGHDLMKRFLEAGNNIHHLKFSFYRYRIHGNNRTITNQDELKEYDKIVKNSFKKKINVVS